MAKMSCFSGTLLHPLHNQLKFRRNHGIQSCSNTSIFNTRRTYASLNSEREKESETPQILKIAVTGVTELLRLFSPPSNQTSLEKQIDEVPASTVDDVLRIIKSDYDNAYFVTGNFTSSIYAENCIYEDPTIKFRGKNSRLLPITTCMLKRKENITVKMCQSSEAMMHGHTGRELYARNLKLLVPFFDCASIILQKIEKDIVSETNFVMASWKLRTNLKLPWRPLISINGSTTYELDKDYKIVRHVESWDVSAVEAVLQIFSFKFENSGG